MSIPGANILLKDAPMDVADSSVLTWKFTAMVMSVCALLLSPTLAFRMGADQGVFAYMGAELLEVAGRT